MTEKVNFYQHAKVYKLISNQTDDVYYGSTCGSLSKRIGVHKSSYKKLGEEYAPTAKQILKYKDCDIILVEEYPCDNKEQLHARERYHIENNPCVNKYIPGRTKSEYREANKEKIKEQKQRYYEANDVKLKAQQQGYYEANKDKKKEYQQTNKLKLNKKFVCACGGKYTYQNLSQHSKTQRHIRYEEDNKDASTSEESESEK